MRDCLCAARGTDGDELHTGHIVRAIEAHDPDVPLFAYLALQNPHSPFEVPPPRYTQRVDAYHASLPHEVTATARDGPEGPVLYYMVHVVDDANVTAVLHAKDMWHDTLLVFHSDNGGGGSACTLRRLRLVAARMPLTQAGARGFTAPATRSYMRAPRRSQLPVSRRQGDAV